MKYFVLIITLLFGSVFSGDNCISAQELNFKLKDLNGLKTELTQALKKGPAVISFWATWCHPCQDELRQIQKMHEEFADSGLSFFAISIDGTKDRNRVKALIRGKNFTLPVLLDPEQEAMRSFGLTEVPGLFIVSPQGKLIYRHTGYKPGDEKNIREKIVETLRQQTVPPEAVKVDSLLFKAGGDSL
ncbi:MAG: TlpA family protein disulfide reductase [Candidatus Edwardsbacteria bacterium]|nr:TlpA family protein disulfide reductase [Candidatus Edwardsbacteria bacterium]MBU1576353.1 TlpA family protein disulfide reductase [Candidatus Edwardsbacteria bacterium]MBU2463612.1 TlpA family protein disulfide reductase [Candidatus Edwardsbacteria bacterium]MBU2594645.1 TlpA family protein disulfide reductase [Candidatus Edwardsbacteria bacterium]